jgi:hypothetical protein
VAYTAPNLELMSRMRVIVAGLVWLLPALPVFGQQPIYSCTNESGVKEFTNSPGSGKDRNCKLLDLPTITTIPAPKLPARANGSSAAAASRSPENFPRVDGAAQRARDSDRKQILEDELRKEEVRLIELKKEYNGGEPERQGNERNYQKYLDRVQSLKDDIGRAEGNIASLRRELGAPRE